MQRGSPVAEKIEMSARQYDLLDRERSKQTIARHYFIRINILLRASQGQGNKQIAREERVAANTVRHWRSRWQNAFSELLEFERGISNEGVSDTQLLEKMLEVLSDRPRSGCPAQIQMAQKEQIRALSCEAPKDYGVFMDEWTHKTLAQTAIKKGIVPSISATYVGVILKKTI
jgi:transposase